MENPFDIDQSHQPSLYQRLMASVAGVDLDTLRQCPPHDAEAIANIGLIMSCTFVYQAAVLSMAGYTLYPWEQSGLLPVFVAVFIAGFVLVLDQFTVLRSSWHLSGIADLKRGGIDISGGVFAHIKNGFYLTVRLTLALALAQLTAVFTSLWLYNPDIAKQAQAAFVRENAPLIRTITAPIDAEIQLATDRIRIESKRYTELSNQVAGLRQNELDPEAANAGFRQGQDELTGLLAQKAKADDAVAAAEAFEVNEKGGIKGTADNSGQPGAGPRYLAAQAQRRNAQRRAREAAAAVEAARTRLAAARKQAAPAAEAQKVKSREQLPVFERTLADQAARVAVEKAHLSQLVQQRGKAVRQALDTAPDVVPPDRGLIAQLKVLRHLAEDPEIAAVIILIDLVAFSFEAAGVLAKVTSFVPTNYAGILARNAYLHSVHLADDLDAELQRDRQSPTAGAPAPSSTPEPGIIIPPVYGSGPSADPLGSGPNGAREPKRPRGRPRKDLGNPAAGAGEPKDPIAPAA